MKLLYDAVLPPSLSVEAGRTLELHRWDGSEAADAELVRSAAAGGYRGVIFLDRNSLDQPGLRKTAAGLGVALVAVDVSDPIEGKQRILRNASSLRQKLADHDCLLVLAGEVRPLYEHD
jgi:hypothetical protein